MSNADDRIIRKIQRCLDLSKSSNENEAATALRHAMALMEKHNISEEHLVNARVASHAVNTVYSGRVCPRYVRNLAGIVAQAFQVRGYISRRNVTKWTEQFTVIFYGVDLDAQIAAYAFDALASQIAHARKGFMSETKADPAAKQKLATRFCEGWVSRVGRTVQEFASPISDEHNKMLDAWIRNNNVELRNPKKVRSRMLTGEEASSFHKGAEEGAKAQIHSATTHSPTHQARLK